MESTQQSEQQLYSPAMLAELLGLSVRTIRRWQRLDLIRPVTEVMQLPQFDFAGLAIARQLASWTRQGANPSSIQSQLEAIRERLGDNIPFEDLPILADGKCLIVRDGNQWIEARGQFRFGFEDSESADHQRPMTISIAFREPHALPTTRQVAEEMRLEAMVEQAIAAEDDDDIEAAIRWYRCALSAHGPHADICFQLAELLYRLGDVTAARERYFTALEIDSEMVEARANLGCVLVECGQMDLAIAAFEGALDQYPDYADVHFHLARALDDFGESGRAAVHWRRFLDLAPASPWAEEAASRLKEHVPLEF
jgi:tetratricopeptide (TPR) repeat protein